MPLSPAIWQPYSGSRELAPGEVQVLRVVLDTSSDQLPVYQSLLSPTEQQRANRFKFERDRQRFQVARGALRQLIGRYLDQPPQDVQFEYGPYGKPYLADSDLHFNLSHSQGIGLYGFSWGRPLGIDIEYLRPIPQLLQIARRYFSPQEQTDLASLAEAQQVERFFQYWTCKEAYLKALGTGLSHPIPQLDPTWKAQVLYPVEGAIAALVAPGQDWFPSCWSYP